MSLGTWKGLGIHPPLAVRVYFHLVGCYAWASAFFSAKGRARSKYKLFPNWDPFIVNDVVI